MKEPAEASTVYFEYDKQTIACSPAPYMKSQQATHLPKHKVGTVSYQRFDLWQGAKIDLLRDLISGT